MGYASYECVGWWCCSCCSSKESKERILCVTYESWVMSHESWVMSHESWVMSHESQHVSRIECASWVVSRSRSSFGVAAVAGVSSHSMRDICAMSHESRLIRDVWVMTRDPHIECVTYEWSHTQVRKTWVIPTLRDVWVTTRDAHILCVTYESSHTQIRNTWVMPLMRNVSVMTRDAHILGVTYESCLTRECASHELFLIWMHDLYKKAHLSRYWYSIRDTRIISHANAQHMSCASYQCVIYIRKHALRAPAHLPPFYNPCKYRHICTYLCTFSFQDIFPRNLISLSLSFSLSLSLSFFLSLLLSLHVYTYTCNMLNFRF